MPAIDEGQRTCPCETVLELRRQADGYPRPRRSGVATVSQIEFARWVAILRIQQPNIVSVESEDVRDVLVRASSAGRRDALPVRAIVPGPEEMLICQRPADARRQHFHRYHLTRLRPPVCGNSAQDRQRE